MAAHHRLEGFATKLHGYIPCWTGGMAPGRGLPLLGSRGDPLGFFWGPGRAGAARLRQAPAQAENLLWRPGAVRRHPRPTAALPVHRLRLRRPAVVLRYNPTDPLLALLDVRRVQHIWLARAHCWPQQSDAHACGKHWD